ARLISTLLRMMPALTAAELESITIADRFSIAGRVTARRRKSARRCRKDFKRSASRRPLTRRSVKGMGKYTQFLETPPGDLCLAAALAACSATLFALVGAVIGG